MARVSPALGVVSRDADLPGWPDRRSHSLRLVCLFLCLSWLLPSAFAVTRTVSNTNDSGAGSLRQAIADSNPAGGDTIVFSVTGTISLTSDRLVVSKSLTITGPGPGILAVERSTDGGTPAFRIFVINNGATVTISGLRISNGNIGTDGAGVHVSGGSMVTLSNCTISDNVAFNGGRGGGIFNSSNLLVTGCTVSGNNATTGDGGGIANFGTLTIGASTVNNNNCGGGGGGLYNGFGTMVVVDSTFADNSAQAEGGAILNRVFSVGGVDLTVTNSTFYNNFGVTARSIVNGGPNGPAALTVRSTILQSQGTNLAHSGTGSITSQGYNLSSDSGGGYLTGPADQLNLVAGLDSAGLQDNGGLTRTIALLSGSPAIDQGKNFGNFLDQRGQPRPIDNPAIANAGGGDGSDIGAYEAPLDALQSGNAPLVTTTADHDDGVCGVGDCTLREAVERANTIPGNNTVTFAPAVTGTITLLPAAGGEVTIRNNTSITGPGARLLTVSSNVQTRIFNVASGTSTTISGLTIRDGWVAAGSSSGGSVFGGGVLNFGALTLTECALINNRAVGGSGLFPGGNGGTGSGGAIANLGSLTVNRCTFSANGASGGSGADAPGAFAFGGSGGSAFGGAIFNTASASVTINNCTFSGNSASAGNGGDAHFGGNGGSAQGGAIYNAASVILTASTLRGNSGQGGSGGTGSNMFNDGVPGEGVGGFAAAGGSSTVRNSISAGNSGNNGGGGDADGAFTSEGYNMIGIGDFSSGFNGPADQVGTSAAPINPNLGPLQDNTGPTDTMALLNGSPALDQGKSFGLTTDQRGGARPVDDPVMANAFGGDGSDIGAFELGGLFIVTTVDDHNDGSCNPTDCTLREAINASNALFGNKLILFAPGIRGTIQLTTALPAVSSDVRLLGPGANVLSVRRNSAGDYRIFTISNGTTSGPVVEISGLTIANGLLNGPNFPANSGAGLWNDNGFVTLAKCAVTGNTSYYGGGLSNVGSAVLTLIDCTVNGNTAAFSGGGIYNVNIAAGQALVTLRNCTFSGNGAETGGGLSNYVALGSNSAVLIQSSTFGGNSASVSGGAIQNQRDTGSATVQLANTILRTGNAGANLHNLGGASISSQGSNISDDAAGGDGGTGPGGFLNAAGDRRNTDPLLDPAGLAENGGPTKTIALLSGSPAINAANAGLAPALDQRGYLRSGAPDIGAFELFGVALRITSITRLANGHIVLQGIGVPNALHTIEASGDGPYYFGALGGPVTANGSGQITFEDTGATGLTRRFYRLSFP